MTEERGVERGKLKRLRRPFREFLVVSFALWTSVAVAVLWFAWVDVRGEAKRLGGPSATVTLAGVWASGTHVVSVEFSLSGVPELDRAYWRLAPWREVEVTK